MEVNEIIAGCFVIGSIVLSASQIIKHLVYYNEPNLQFYIIRILLMLPVIDD